MLLNFLIPFSRNFLTFLLAFLFRFLFDLAEICLSEDHFHVKFGMRLIIDLLKNFILVSFTNLLFVLVILLFIIIYFGQPQPFIFLVCLVQKILILVFIILEIIIQVFDLLALVLFCKICFLLLDP